MHGGVAGFASTNCNLERYRPNDIVSYALDLVRAVNDRRESPPIPPPDDASVTLEAKEYEGDYNFGTRNISIQADKNGHLHYSARIDVGFVLLNIGKDRFVPQPRQLGDDRYTVVFGRESGKVVELFRGPGWYTNDRYSGPREFQYPKEWEGFAGHYRNNDPWQGSAYVFLRKGKLWLADDELTPLSNGLFRPGNEEYSPERVSFDTIVEGKAQRMVFSGVDFDRTAE